MSNKTQTTPAMTSADVRELLPCPFCKRGEASLDLSKSLCGSYFVDCGCNVQGPWASTKAEAIAAWNTRHSVSTVNVDQLREAAKGMIAAWEHLPGDRHYGPKTIDYWLNDKLAPALNDLRAALASMKGPEA